jgi:conjugal transfer pilus assembly protein TraD
MNTSTRFPHPGTGLLPSLEKLWSWVLGAGEHLMLGLVLGALIAAAMRALRLSWTWGLAGTSIAVVAHSQLGSLGWPIGIACVFACKLARKREREDRIETSGAAERARGPVAIVAIACHAALAAWRQRGGRWFSGNALLVGFDAGYNAAEVPLQGSSGGAHTLVLGAAGSGKTVTQTWLAVRAIEAGMPAIVIDPKDDPDLAGHVRAAARSAGKQFFEWSPDGACVYNPYASGSNGEIADKALAGERFTEPHYLRQAQRFIGREVSILRRAGVQISIETLASHLDPDRLETALRGLPEEQVRGDYEYLDSLTSRQRSDLSGVRDRLAILAESDVGPWLNPATKAPSFALLGCLREGAVVLFRLRSDSRPLLMQMLGGAIVLDLLSTTAALQRRRIPSIAVIDEFAALAAPQIGGLFGRARGAGMSLVLGTQEVSDLRLPGRENLLRQVTGNLTATISHRQVNPESAEWVSELAGRRSSWSTTLSSDGRCTYRPTQEPLIAPERVRALTPGQAAVIVHDGPSRGARIVQMLAVSRQSQEEKGSQ